MKRKEMIFLIVIMIFGTVLSGCRTKEPARPTDDSPQVEMPDEDTSENDRISIVATLFPQYDFARTIGGVHVDVRYLLPTGTEAHSYEPTPQDMVALLNADVFLYTGELMEPWTVNIVSNLEDEDVMIVDLSQDISLLTNEDHDHEHDDEDEHDDEEEVYDPHYWTDPNMAIIMVNRITESLVEIDPENRDEYQENGDKLKADLKELDDDIREALAKTKSKTILSGGHFAFGYFAKQYGLEHMSPYTGFSPNAEPTPQRITALINTINETGAMAIFHEELIDPKVAQVIVEETGVKMLLLHGAHNISKEELDSGKTYIEIMYDNLENLKEGLGYEE
ncbi:metal ABC transporter substrate-binding protein [Gudongella sp. DL1XJH-153]|uniref:metal ABC transporter substrate-binding protein n=1 Tax=Gudongella sp. DL1XJH-153 TaxID=3409804 RepID=UPI003BB4EC54